jgi:hypothetical protein
LYYGDLMFVYGTAGEIFPQSGFYSITTDPSRWPVYYIPEASHTDINYTIGPVNSSSVCIVGSGGSGGILTSCFDKQ